MARTWTITRRIAVTGACATAVLLPFIGIFILAINVGAGSRATDLVPPSSDLLARTAMVAGCAGAFALQVALLVLTTGSVVTGVLWLFGWRRHSEGAQ